jgi:hypothetical protein
VGVQRSMSWKAAAVCLSIMLVGCASSSRSSRDVARATALATPTPSTTDVSQSPSWRDEGTTLKKADSYDYSYESLPVDVNGPGPQTLDIVNGQVWVLAGGQVKILAPVGV